MAAASRATRSGGSYAAALRVLGIRARPVLPFQRAGQGGVVVRQRHPRRTAPTDGSRTPHRACAGTSKRLRLPACRCSRGSYPIAELLDRRRTDPGLLDASGRIPRVDDGGEFQLRAGDVSLGRISDRRRRAFRWLAACWRWRSPDRGCRSACRNSSHKSRSRMTVDLSLVTL